MTFGILAEVEIVVFMDLNDVRILEKGHVVLTFV